MPDIQPSLAIHLWFDTEAREAAEFYTAVFPGARIKHSTTLEGTPSGDVEMVVFELLGHEFMAISAGPLFEFNESVSFVVKCETQEEIDYYWDALTRDGGREVECGWLKDRYGVSWQVVPAVLGEMMTEGDAAARARVTQAFLQMKKFDIAALERAYAGGDG